MPMKRMRKNVTITIAIDTTRTGEVMSGRLEDGSYFVEVPAPQGHPNQTDILGLTCHEIGHILGNVFELPGNMNDPRTTHQLFHDTSEVKEKMVASEREADDIAEEMGLPLDPATIQEALDSYESTPPSAFDASY